MLRRFLAFGVGTLVLLVVLHAPGQVQARPMHGGFSHMSHPVFHGMAVPGFQRGFSSRFNGGFFTPRFDSRLNRGFFTPRFDSHFNRFDPRFNRRLFDRFEDRFDNRFESPRFNRFGDPFENRLERDLFNLR
jgi:hypothetical protein